MIQNESGRSGDKITVVVDRDIQELVPVFLENRQHDIRTILASLEQGDYETVRILGHSMKGAGGGYGFDDISEIGAALEMAARERKPDSIRKVLGWLEKYLQRVEVVYEDQ